MRTALLAFTIISAVLAAAAQDLVPPEVVRLENIKVDGEMRTVYAGTVRVVLFSAFDLPAAHMFKIRNGKIYDIEAIGYMGKHGIKNGWE